MYFSFLPSVSLLLVSIVLTAATPTPGTDSLQDNSFFAYLQAGSANAEANGYYGHNYLSALPHLARNADADAEADPVQMKSGTASPSGSNSNSNSKGGTGKSAASKLSFASMGGVCGRSIDGCCGACTDINRGLSPTIPMKKRELSNKASVLA